jgi:hypothetical protein
MIQILLVIFPVLCDKMPWFSWLIYTHLRCESAECHSHDRMGCDTVMLGANVLRLSLLHSEDGSRKFLCNVGKLCTTLYSVQSHNSVVLLLVFLVVFRYHEYASTCWAVIEHTDSG